MGEGIFSALHVSAMGLRAQRIRLDVAAENLANLDTTKTPAGGPYRPKLASVQMGPGPRPALGPVKRQAPGFAELLETSRGHMQPAPAAEDPTPRPEPSVDIRIEESADPFYSEYDPQHPDADAQGLVLKPNVDPVQEMMTLIKATRAYEANATALDAAKQMLSRALEI